MRPSIFQRPAWMCGSPSHTCFLPHPPKPTGKPEPISYSLPTSPVPIPQRSWTRPPSPTPQSSWTLSSPGLPHGSPHPLAPSFLHAPTCLVPLPLPASRPAPGPGSLLRMRTAGRPRRRRAAQCAAVLRPPDSQPPRCAGGVTSGAAGPDPGGGGRHGAPTRAPPVPALTASSCFRFTSSASSRRVSGICGGAALLCIAMLCRGGRWRGQAGGGPCAPPPARGRPPRHCACARGFRRLAVPRRAPARGLARALPGGPQCWALLFVLAEFLHHKFTVSKIRPLRSLLSE